MVIVDQALMDLRRKQRTQLRDLTDGVIGLVKGRALEGIGPQWDRNDPGGMALREDLLRLLADGFRASIEKRHGQVFLSWGTHQRAKLMNDLLVPFTGSLPSHPLLVVAESTEEHLKSKADSPVLEEEDPLAWEVAAWIGLVVLAEMHVPADEQDLDPRLRPAPKRARATTSS